MENSSDKVIIPTNYYIVTINIDNNNKKSQEICKNLGKEFLTTNVLEERPIITYIYQNSLLMLFSCIDDNLQHNMNGSHQNICSLFVCKFCNNSCKSVRCNIIEFQQRSDIFTYLMWKIHKNMHDYIRIITNNSISVEDTPLQELVNILFNEYNIDWDDIPAEEKYGKFLRLKRKNKKLMMIGMSELFDAQNKKKYMNYLFN